MLRSFTIAWHFLTAVPLQARCHEATPQELARSMAWFPVVGMVLGGVLAGTDLVLSATIPPSILNVLLIAWLVLLTGGLHVDGLADSVDGIAGGRTPTDRLAIMRDARIGAIGATGLMLALGLRYAGLMAVPHAERLAVLLCMPALGRWAMVVTAFSMPYARPEGGLAQPFLQQLSAREVLAATIVPLGALCWFFGARGIVVFAVIAMIAQSIAALSRRLLGGITGDVLGAANEIAEIVFVIAITAMAVRAEALA
jgi:adenosylcobinamide-GDP ribazoletransferase